MNRAMIVVLALLPLLVRSVSAQPNPAGGSDSIYASGVHKATGVHYHSATPLDELVEQSGAGLFVRRDGVAIDPPSSLYDMTGALDIFAPAEDEWAAQFTRDGIEGASFISTVIFGSVPVQLFAFTSEPGIAIFGYDNNTTSTEGVAVGGLTFDGVAISGEAIGEGIAVRGLSGFSSDARGGVFDTVYVGYDPNMPPMSWPDRNLYVFGRAAFAGRTEVKIGAASEFARAGGTIYADSGTTVAIGTSETPMAAVTLPGRTFVSVHDAVRVQIHGARIGSGGGTLAFYATENISPTTTLGTLALSDTSGQSFLLDVTAYRAASGDILVVTGTLCYIVSGSGAVTKCDLFDTSFLNEPAGVNWEEPLTLWVSFDGNSGGDACVVTRIAAEYIPQPNP